MGIEGRYITTNSHGEAESHADDEHHHHPEKMRRVDHHAACLLYEPAEEAVEAVQELGLGSDPSVHTDASDSNHKKLYLLPPLPLVEDDSSSISDNNTIDPKDSSINPHCNPTSDDKSDPNHSANSKTSTIRRVLDLLKTFTPGSDLTRLQVYFLFLLLFFPFIFFNWVVKQLSSLLTTFKVPYITQIPSN